MQIVTNANCKLSCNRPLRATPVLTAPPPLFLALQMHPRRQKPANCATIPSSRWFVWPAATAVSRSTSCWRWLAVICCMPASRRRRARVSSARRLARATMRYPRSMIRWVLNSVQTYFQHVQLAFRESGALIQLQLRHGPASERVAWGRATIWTAWNPYGQLVCSSFLTFLLELLMNMILRQARRASCSGWANRLKRKKDNIINAMSFHSRQTV